MSADRIEKEATEWFAKRESGAWTDLDEAKFEEWREQNIAHRIAYLRIEATWGKLGRLRALGAGVEPGVIPPRGSWRLSKSLLLSAGSSSDYAVSQPCSRKGRLRLVALAAAVLVFAVGVVVVQGRLSSGVHYSTAVGVLSTIPLPDGSRVILNTATSVRVSFSEAERRIRMDEGEAFFDVAKDETRPFTVYAGSHQVVVLGTQFGVRLSHDDVDVVVTRGCVGIASAEVRRVCAGESARTSKGHVPCARSLKRMLKHC
jgi:transmembrane sensor